jgi:ATP-dependent helicase HrpA
MCVGFKLEGDDRKANIRRVVPSFVHPGSPNKKPGKWIVAAELVETTRLFGRGTPTLIRRKSAPMSAGAADPHWKKKSAEVVAPASHL